MNPKGQVKFISGFEFPVEMPDLLCHLQLFLKAPEFQKAGSLYTGEGRIEHARVVAKILWPKQFQWSPWSEQIVRQACDSDYLCITGCGASSKSTSIGMYALEWWMAAPTESAVIIASKTIESAKKRIWREVARLYGAFSNLIGGYRDAVLGQSPRPYICPITGRDRKKDEAHGLYVTALHGKELDKEIGYIKGFHPRRILVVADELDVLEDGGQALVDTFTDNLRTGTYEAQFIGLGNDPSLFNALGDMMAPEIGKPVGLNDHEWTSAKNVKCLRLDAWESPNIKDKDKWQGLVRQRDIDDLVARKGENSPSVWIQLHGLHPPEGSANTVLSEATLIRFHCFEGVTWKTDFTVSASLDPAFGGGDACCFRTFKRGNDTQGKLKILCDEVLNLPVSANDPANPAEYQIAAKVRELCRTRKIAPDEFVVGSETGGSGEEGWNPGQTRKVSANLKEDALMRVLVNCEESQAVCIAFRERGHEAYSCDLLGCSGGHPEWHIRGDARLVLNDGWDLMIAHPPCTRLCVSGNKWYKPEYSDRFPNIHQEREEAVEFFMTLANADIPKKCIENPVGIMSTRWRKPDQIIQPFQFGHPEPKKTCLWLYWLPNLVPTREVEPEYFTTKSGKKMATWFYKPSFTPQRQKMRSVTFPGIARAMAEQWG